MMMATASCTAMVAVAAVIGSIGIERVYPRKFFMTERLVSAS
jgi:hypothetical protein